MDDIQSLLNSAKAMLQSFEQWLAHHRTAKAYESLMAFDATWHTYYNLFEAWKSQDTERLIKNMIKHYVQLERLWKTVQTQVDADTDWKPSIEQQRHEIRDRIVKIGGPAALERLETEAQKILDGSRTADKKSVSTPSSPPLEPSRSADSEQLSITSSPIKQLPTPSSSPSPKKTNSVSMQSIASDQAFKIVSLFGAPNMTNQQLAHELIMDPDFKLKAPEDSTFVNQVREVATRAFFDSVRDDFQRGNYAKWIPSLIGDVRQRLLELTPPKSAFRVQVEEVLDIDLISQQVQAGVYDIKKFLDFTTHIMLQLCAPARDETIREIANLTDYATSFQRILETLDKMRLDLANFRLQTLRPYLKLQAIDYERSKFDDSLKAGQITLERTKAWIGSIVKSLKEAAAQRNPENIDIPDNNLKYEVILNEAFLSFLFSTQPIDPPNAPETLQLDVDRLSGYQNEFQAITIVSALLMLSKTVAPSLPLEPNRLKERLFILLQDGTTSIDNLSAEMIAAFGTPLPAEKQSLVRSMVDKTLSYKDAVYSLLSRRVQNCVRAQLSTNQFPKKESLASYGLDHVATELEALSKKVWILVTYNREVYAQHYDEIIKSCLE